MTRFLIKIALRERRNLLISFFLALFTVVTELASPLVLARLLDSELIQGQGPKDPRNYAILMGVFFILVLIGAGLSFLSNYGFQRCANSIASMLQREMFSLVQDLPVSYFDKHPSGQLVSRIVNDANDVRILFQTVLSQMLIALLYLIGIYSILFTKATRLGLIALLPLPLMALLIYFYSAKAQGYNTSYRRELSAVNSHISESIQGMSLMQSLGKEDLLLEEYEVISRRLYDTGLKMTRLEALASWNAVGFLGAITRAFILLVFGLSHFKSSAMSLGEMYLLIDFSIKIFNQLQNIMQRIGQLESARGAYRHLSQLLEVEKIPARDKRIDFAGDVKFKNLNFSYNKDQAILRDISFHLEPGKTLAIVGATGSGKSTIMNLVFGFYPYKDGEILLDDTPLSELDIKSLRAQSAMVLQEPYLLKASLYDNIAFSRELDREKIMESLVTLGGRELLAKLKGGLDGLIEEGGANLSAGEKQLISFARALAGDPKLLLLDEATANIDSQTEALIQSSIKKLSKNRSTIIIAHRLSTIQEADKILLLHQGRILEEGNHQELMEKKGAYYKLVMEEK